MRLKLLFLCLLFALPAGAQTWTATVLPGAAKDSNGNQVVPLHFEDGAGTSYDVNDFIPFGAPPTQLSDFVADVIAKLSLQSSVFKAAPAAGNLVTPTPPAIVQTDANAAIKAAFLADYLLLRQYQAAISHGLILSSDLNYVAQLNKTSSEFIANKAILLPLIEVGP